MNVKKWDYMFTFLFAVRYVTFAPTVKSLMSLSGRNRYVENLLQEIRLVCTNHPKREVTSLYFGGGTPALLYQRLEEIIQELRRLFRYYGGHWRRAPSKRRYHTCFAGAPSRGRYETEHRNTVLSEKIPNPPWGVPVWTIPLSPLLLPRFRLKQCLSTLYLHSLAKPSPI